MLFTARGFFYMFMLVFSAQCSLNSLAICLGYSNLQAFFDLLHLLQAGYRSQAAHRYQPLHLDSGRAGGLVHLLLLLSCLLDKAHLQAFLGHEICQKHVQQSSLLHCRQVAALLSLFFSPMVNLGWFSHSLPK